MTKGRQFVPSCANDGTWFAHKSQGGTQEGNNCNKTSKSTMLQAQVSARSHPNNLPRLFIRREKTSYRTSNPFSVHDKRHVIESQAEYLGNGSHMRHFGRRLHPIDCRLHHTDATFLHHNNSDSPHRYSPTTATTYTDPCLLEPVTTRRFPKIYKTTETSQPPTRRASGHEIPYRTPLHVLAVTQQPLATHSDWKYSFHGDTSVYPPYHTKKYHSS
ncbi:unnamed protein product [Candidula unifasciata]|uniref:Domain of unknown function with conserved HDNR motif domain-containing protein n=1 Tax=Candidula unifasciata TaxID=100452 RepID=A0A8S3YYB4_9EUPU|nr:unnamed protein product [Candidula unifasciata]